VYDSNEALINDEKVDIVVIAIPNDDHAQWVIKAL
jgi:predicted dehydrogenase